VPLPEEGRWRSAREASGEAFGVERVAPRLRRSGVGGVKFHLEPKVLLLTVIPLVNLPGDASSIEVVGQNLESYFDQDPVSGTDVVRVEGHVVSFVLLSFGYETIMP
jgi:hypothetical protein